MSSAFSKATNSDDFVWRPFVLSVDLSGTCTHVVTRDLTVLCVQFHHIGINVNYDDSVYSIEFEGQSSNVKVIDKCGARGKATLCFVCLFFLAGLQKQFRFIIEYNRRSLAPFYSFQASGLIFHDIIESTGVHYHLG